jgi:hypothetical protein
MDPPEKGARNRRYNGLKMAFHTTYILIRNFESESKELPFDEFSIKKIDNSNYDELKAIFKSIYVYRFGHHFIERRYTKLPSLPEGEEDLSGLGRIPYDSGDLMLLLRLFKAGDIVFVAQTIKRANGDCLSQYPVILRVDSGLDPNDEVRKSIRSLFRREFEALGIPKNRVAPLISEEKEWFASTDRRVVGPVVRDRTDNDWVYVLFSQTENGTFQVEQVEVDIKTREKARELLLDAMEASLKSG